MWQYAQMVVDSTPEFYLEHLGRLRKSASPALFRARLDLPILAIVERLIRQGVYMGPMNGFFSMIGGVVQAPIPSTGWS